ncbi:MAG: DoxX family protein [Chitinophagales bacterium]|nr:DoxX family protein [Chitinophagales bacterium]
MKKTKIIYWVSTLLFAAFMTWSSIPDLMLNEQAVQFMNQFLGFPNYFTQFLGGAKMLGVVALLIPGFPRIKEWVYAGFAFDLFGAIYSVIAAGGLNAGMLVMLVPIGLGSCSYIFYHKLMNKDSGITETVNEPL